MGAWYPLVQFADKEDLHSNAQIVDQMKTLNEPYIPYLRYNRFVEMADLFDAAMKFAPTASRDDLKTIARGFLRYFNRYTSYALFHYDWKALGDKCPYDTSLATPQVDLSRRVCITDGQKIKLSWEKLDIAVYAFLATKENPELANAFAHALPFETLHAHVMVSGKSTYAWAPIVTTAEAPVMERLCDAPVGRLLFSKATGMKLLIIYGEITEDVPMPILGEILPQYQPLLTELGAKLWTSTYETKEEIRVKVELASS